MNMKFYTQTYNSKIKLISSTDDMKYEYILDLYNKNETKKEITFKISSCFYKKNIV